MAGFVLTPDQAFLIPFLFVFAIVFGALEMTRVFKNKAVHAIISFALAVFAATYTPFLNTFQGLLPELTWFFIVIFFIAFVLRIFGVKSLGFGEHPDKGKNAEGMVVGAGVLIVLMGIGFTMLDQFNVSFPVIGGGDNLLFILGFVIILSLFWGVVKTGPGPQPGQQPQK